MTEASSGQPNTPEQQPVEANPEEPTTPDQNQTDSSRNVPSSAAQEPAKWWQRRSNEFWLALAGIAATLIVGLTASLVAYLVSIHHDKAESDQAALSFSRKQKENAYAAFLDSVAALDHQELVLADLVLNPAFDIKKAEYQLKLQQDVNLQQDAFSKFVRASSTVRLVACPDVEDARKRIRDKHNHILQYHVGPLMEVAQEPERATPEKATRLANDLHDDLDLKPDLVDHFVDVAKRDLALSGNCVANPE